MTHQYIVVKYDSQIITARTKSILKVAEGSMENLGIEGGVLEEKVEMGLSENGNLGELEIGSGVRGAHEGTVEVLVGGGKESAVVMKTS